MSTAALILLGWALGGVLILIDARRIRCERTPQVDARREIALERLAQQLTEEGRTLIATERRK